MISFTIQFLLIDGWVPCHTFGLREILSKFLWVEDFDVLCVTTFSSGARLTFPRYWRFSHIRVGRERIQTQFRTYPFLSRTLWFLPRIPTCSDSWKSKGTCNFQPFSSRKRELSLLVGRERTSGTLLKWTPSTKYSITDKRSFRRL